MQPSRPILITTHHSLKSLISVKGHANSRQAAAVIASHNPADIGSFYRHLVEHIFHGDPAKAAKASSEIRDVLTKSWTLIGIPPVIVAIGALIKQDDTSFLGESVLSEKW